MRMRKLCNFLCLPGADQMNVMSIEVNTGSYEVSAIEPLRANSWLPLPYPTKWHMDWRCAATTHYYCWSKDSEPEHTPGIGSPMQ